MIRQLLLILFIVLSHSIGAEPRHHLTVHTASSYNGRATPGSIFGGFVIGPILFIWSFILLWYNQKKAAIDYRRIKIAEQICLDINPYSPGNIGQNHNKLVHMTGDTISTETVGDPLSGVFCNNSIKLVRKVQVMQWRATRHDRNGYTDVEYHLSWQAQNQQRAEDRTNEPSNWFIKSDQILSKKVSLGQYYLGDQQKKKCKKAVVIYPNPQNAQQIMYNSHRNNQPQIMGEYIYFPSVYDNNINSHGALRVSYFQCPVGPITIMAKSNNNSFEPFHIAAYQNNGQQDDYSLPTWCCCCLSNCTQQLLKPISLIDFVYEQKLSRQQVITKQLEGTKMCKNCVRVLCYFLMAFGIALFFSPITQIIGFIPLIGGFISGALFFLILLSAFIICIPLFLLALSVAWLVFNPKVGLILVGIGIAILALVLVLTKGGHSNASTSKHLIDIGFLALRNTS